ncbi:hypothetical protein PISMIDRAFT_12665 [Pisolithus microcarpus 441]|uniref:Uncharacterized protein n=1 Tax=Pisolithus microcarpus 441 TaxID=765257 RepID=A0A0C9Y8B9_9AGAM|nr:hypothetical protein PISMIDRAFT_12665 [Pisolithus microcarpus 441]
MSKEGSPDGTSNVSPVQEEQAPTTSLSSAPMTTTPTVSNNLPVVVPTARESMTSSVVPSSTPTTTVTKGKKKETSVERERDSGSKIEKTEKLTDQNWTAWKKKIAAALQAHDLYDVVTGRDAQPSEGRLDELKDWSKRDRIAYATLMANLANDQTVHAHPGTETSAALWRNLHLVHETQGGRRFKHPASYY